MVNTPSPQSGVLRDALEIRLAAVEEGVLCLTTMETAVAAAESLAVRAFTRECCDQPAQRRGTPVAATIYPCNLSTSPAHATSDPEEITRRKRAAVAGLVATLLLGVALACTRSHPSGFGPRLLIALPLTGAAIGWIQARRRFCMAYGLAGTFNLEKIGNMSRE